MFDVNDNPIRFVLRFLELETLRFSCTPVFWGEYDGVFVMQPMEAREMEVAG